MEAPMLKEFEKWRIDNDEISEVDLKSFKNIFLEHRVYFFGLYRFIAQDSDSYPHINQNDIVKTFNICKIMNTSEKVISPNNSDDEDENVEMTDL